MPANITARTTWVFTAPRGYGWTENFYQTAPSLAQALANITQAMINHRLAILSGPMILSAIKVTDVTPAVPPLSPTLRQTLLYAPSGVIGSGNATLADPGSLLAGEPYQSLVIRMEATQQYRRAFLMRGIADDITDAGGNFTPTPAFLTNFRTWYADYVGQGSPWGLQTISAGPTINPVTWALQQGNTQPTFDILAGSDPIWRDGQIIKISGAVGAAFLNGYWKISGNGIASIKAGLNVITYFLKPKKRAVCGTPTNLPRVNPITKGFVGFTAVWAERGAKKATGRPIGPSRGRARVRTA